MEMCDEEQINICWVDPVEEGEGGEVVVAGMDAAVEHDVFAFELEDDARSADFAAAAQRNDFD